MKGAASFLLDIFKIQNSRRMKKNSKNSKKLFLEKLQKGLGKLFVIS